MNAREQYLKKQNERLEAQLYVALRALDNAVDESEYRASVACGFAWDMTVNFSKMKEEENRDPAWNAIDECERVFEATWTEGVVALEKQNSEKIYEYARSR